MHISIHIVPVQVRADERKKTINNNKRAMRMKRTEDDPQYILSWSCVRPQFAKGRSFPSSSIPGIPSRYFLIFARRQNPEQLHSVLLYVKVVHRESPESQSDKTPRQIYTNNDNSTKYKDVYIKNKNIIKFFT